MTGIRPDDLKDARFAPSLPAQSRLQQATAISSDLSADEAARQWELAKRTRLPLAVVAADPTRIEQAANMPNFDPEQFAQRDPAVKTWLEAHPYHPALSRGDLDKLEGVTGALRRSWQNRGAIAKDVIAGVAAIQTPMGASLAGAPLAEAVSLSGVTQIPEVFLASKAIKSSVASNEQARIYADILTRSIRSGVEQTTPADRARLETLAKDIIETPEGLGTFHRALFESAVIAGQVGEMTTHPRVLGLTAAGGMVGGIAGSILPGAGTAAGIETGAGLGYKIAMGQQMFFLEGGSTYQAIGEIRGVNGERVDERTRQAAAIGAGVIKAGMEYASLDWIAGRVKSGAAQLSSATLGSALTNPKAIAALAKIGSPILAAMKAGGMEIAKTTALEATQEIMQEAVDIVAESVARDASKGTFQSPSWADNIARLEDIGEKMLYAGPLLALPSAGLHGAARYVEAKTAIRRAEEFKALGQSVATSATEKRAPGSVRGLVEALGADTGGAVETLYIDPSSFDAYAQTLSTPTEEQKASGAVLAVVTGRDLAVAILGDATAYEEAVQQGGAVEIPTATYAEKVAPTAANEFFRNELRVMPDGINAREAVAEVARLRTEATAFAEQEATDAIETPPPMPEATPEERTTALAEARSLKEAGVELTPLQQELVVADDKAQRRAAKAEREQADEARATTRATFIDQTTATMTAQLRATGRLPEATVETQARATATALVTFAERQARSEGVPFTPEYLATHLAKYGPTVVAGTAEGMGLEQRVSTRVPTAVRATEDPMLQQLTVGLESSQADPKAFGKNMQLVRDYVGLKLGKKATDADVASVLIDHARNNLLWLYDQMPPAVRDRAKQWYVGARKMVDTAVQTFGVTDVQAAGVYAVLSPQKDWYQNADLGRRVMDIWTSKQDFAWTPEMEKEAKRILTAQDTKAERDKLKSGAMTRAEVDAAKAERQKKLDKLYKDVRGKTLRDQKSDVMQAMWTRIYDEAYHARSYPTIHPEGFTGDVVRTQKGEPQKIAWGSYAEIAKAISILKDGSMENVSQQLGEMHKVRNFYNNIFEPFGQYGDVTIDTHAVAAALLRPLAASSREVQHNFGGGGSASSSVFGAQGTYGLYAEAYRQAAVERNILPREMQSITWEAVRGLFEAKYKTEANAKEITALWKDYAEGKRTLDETRAAITEAAGGFVSPSWAEPGAGGVEAAGMAPDTGELPAGGVRGAGARPASRRVGGLATSELAPEGAAVEGVAASVTPQELFQRTVSTFPNAWAPPFYSKAERLVAEKVPNNATPDQVKATLAGIKAEERKWLGIDEFLAAQSRAGKTTVDKAELQQWIAAHNMIPRIVEDVRGGKPAINNVERIEELTAEYEQVLEGRDELRLRNPDESLEGLWEPEDVAEYERLTREEARIRRERQDLADEEDVADTKFERYIVGEGKLSDAEEAKGYRRTYREILFTMPDILQSFYYENHWGRTRNVIGHIRSITRDVWRDGVNLGKALLVEEIQTDAQGQARKRVEQEIRRRLEADGLDPYKTGKKSAAWKAVAEAVKADGFTGYYDPAKDPVGQDLAIELRELEDERDTFWSGVEQALEEKDKAGESAAVTPEQHAKFAKMQKAIDRAQQRLDDHYEREGQKSDLVPQFPFKGKWHEFSLKRMIRMAAEEGFDRIAWVTGATTRDRYSLAKHADTAQYDRETQTLTLWKDGAEVYDNFVAIEDLADTIGDGPTQRLFEMEPITARQLWEQSADKVKQDALKVRLAEAQEEYATQEKASEIWLADHLPADAMSAGDRAEQIDGLRAALASAEYHLALANEDVDRTSPRSEFWEIADRKRKAAEQRLAKAESAFFDADVAGRAEDLVREKNPFLRVLRTAGRNIDSIDAEIRELAPDWEDGTVERNQRSVALLDREIAALEEQKRKLDVDGSPFSEGDSSITRVDASALNAEMRLQLEEYERSAEFYAEVSMDLDAALTRRERILLSIEKLIAKADEPRSIITGEDISVGGEWAFNLYDKTITNVIKGMGKNYGAVIEDTQVENDDGTMETVHSMTIPQALKDAALGEGFELFQRREGEARARIQAKYDPSTRVITLTPNANLSSVIHEFGHHIVETMAAFVADGSADPQMAADFTALVRAAGLTPVEGLSLAETWEGMTLEERRPYHEWIAEANEKYLSEGRSPSEALRAVFARIKLWMLALYRSALNSSARIELSDEVRAVFDRVYASDEEIAAARGDAALKPLFADATAASKAGLSAADYARYTTLFAAAQQVASDALNAEMQQEYQRESMAWWTDAKAQEATRINATLDRDPVYIALQGIATGTIPNGGELDRPVKIDRAAVIAAKGEAFTQGLEAKGLVAEAGMMPDDVAETFGFTNADQMLDALRSAPDRETVVQEQVDAAMREQYGDMLTDGTLPKAAQEATLDEAAEEVAFTELQMMEDAIRGAQPLLRSARRERQQAEAEARRNSAYERRWLDAEAKLVQAMDRAASEEELTRLKAEVAQAKQARTFEARKLTISQDARQVYTDVARETVGRIPYRSLKPNTYWAAARNASLKAIDEAAAGRWQSAKEWKAKHLLNIALYRETIATKAAMDKQVKWANTLTTDAAQERLGKSGKPFLEAVNAILTAYSFAPMTGVTIDLLADIAQVAAYQEAHSLPLTIQPELLALANRKPWKTMTRDELSAVVDTLKTVVASARNEQRIKDGERTVRFETARAEVIGQIEANATETVPQSAERDVPAEGKFKSRALNFLAEHLKYNTILREMAGWTMQGPLFRYLARGMNDAAASLAERKQIVNAQVTALFEAAYSKAEFRAMFQQEWNSTLKMPLSKKGLLVIALNQGTLDNRDKVRAGLASTLKRTIDQSEIDRALNALDARDVQFVQSIWDYLETFWPEVSALSERLDGIPPAKMDAAPWMTAHGTMRGGYYPMGYDSHQNDKVRDLEEKRASEQALNGSAVRKTTKSAARNDRLKNSGRPVRLDFSVLFNHLNDVLLDLTHTEALSSAMRLLMAPDVREAIVTHYGIRKYHQLIDALKSVAGGDEGTTTEAMRWMEWARQGASVVSLGWNVTNSMLQATGGITGASHIGVKWAAIGHQKLLQGRTALIKAIQEKSTMMRTRASNLSPEIAEVLNATGMDASTLSYWTDRAIETGTLGKFDLHDAQKGMFYLQAKMQMVADYTTWIGQYEKAMATLPPAGPFLTLAERESQAIALADIAVRETQGTGFPIDLAKVQRGGPAVKIWLQFYNYMNTMYQQSYSSWKQLDVKKPESIGVFAADLLLLYVAPQAIELAWRGAVGGGGGDDKDAFWLKLSKRIGAFAVGQVIVLREIASAIQSYRGYEGPASVRWISALADLEKQIAQGMADTAFWRSLNLSMGILLHYPAAQLDRFVRGVNALREGRTTNPLAPIFGPPSTSRNSR